MSNPQQAIAAGRAPWESYRDNFSRHLIGVSRYMQTRMMNTLQQECGHRDLRLGFAPYITLIDRQGCREMIENILGEIPNSVLDRIIERTDGIPLFVEEISRALQSGAAGDAVAFDVPDTLADSLNARLDSLGDARRTAQAVARHAE